MALVEVSNRDKKLITWNFMEELCEYYQYSVEHKIDKQFKFNEFHNISIMIRFLRKEGVEGLPDKIVVDTLNEYAKDSGYINVEDKVSLTQKGLAEYKKPHPDWS